MAPYVPRTPQSYFFSVAGFDPLRLGANQETLNYLQEAELMKWATRHCRNHSSLTSLVSPSGGRLTRLVGDFRAEILLSRSGCHVGLEAARFPSFLINRQSGVIGNFPFDPTGQDSPEMRVKAVKNGRLAMMSFFWAWSPSTDP